MFHFWIYLVSGAVVWINWTPAHFTTGNNYIFKSWQRQGLCKGLTNQRVILFLYYLNRLYKALGAEAEHKEVHDLFLFDALGTLYLKRVYSKLHSKL